MFKLSFSGRFSRDVKTIVKRGYDVDILKHAILHLEETGTLPRANKPHKLTGNYTGYWEAHLKPDWLIIWKRTVNEIQLTRTGTHSDLF
jgi:mRNA interferase YafQ